MGTIYLKGGTDVRNTTAETSLFTSAPTIPANFFTATGTTVKVTIRGSYKTDVVPPTIAFRSKLGASTPVSSGVVTALASSAAFNPFEITVMLIAIATGFGGSFSVDGWAMMVNGTTAGTVAFFPIFTGASIYFVDSTIDNLLDVTVQWGTASATNIITADITLVEILSPA